MPVNNVSSKTDVYPPLKFHSQACSESFPDLALPEQCALGYPPLIRLKVRGKQQIPHTSIVHTPTVFLGSGPHITSGHKPTLPPGHFEDGFPCRPQRIAGGTSGAFFK